MKRQRWKNWHTALRMRMRWWPGIGYRKDYKDPCESCLLPTVLIGPPNQPMWRLTKWNACIWVQVWLDVWIMDIRRGRIVDHIESQVRSMHYSTLSTIHWSYRDELAGAELNVQNLHKEVQGVSLSFVTPTYAAVNYDDHPGWCTSLNRKISWNSLRIVDVLPK